MMRNARWMLSFTVAAALFLMLWDFTPRVVSKNGDSAKAGRHKAVPKAKSLPSIDQDGQERKAPPQGKVATVNEDPDVGSDPDLPAFMDGKISKEEYLARRGEYINMVRGLDDENAAELRAEAIELLNRREGPKEGLKERRI